MYPARIGDRASPAVAAIGYFFRFMGFLPPTLGNAAEGSSSEVRNVQHEKEEYPPTVATQLQALRGNTSQQGERANTPPCH